MRMTHDEAVKLLDRLDAVYDGDKDTYEELHQEVAGFLFVSHTPSKGEQVQYKSPKMTSWSDAVEVVAVFPDDSGDDTLVFKYTKPDGSRATNTKLLKNIQVRIAQPRRVRKVNQVPDGTPVQPTKAKS